MTKRRTQSSDDYFDPSDDPIGLTGAFVPVKGPQSVDYAEGDDPVGLTQAFGAIPDQEERRSWSDEDKWKGFDWNAGYEDDRDAGEAAAGAANAPSGEASPEKSASAEEANASAPAATTGSFAPVTPAAATPAATAAAQQTGASRGSGRGRHAAPDLELTPRMQKSRRTRRMLIGLVVLLIILLAAVGFFAFQTFSESQEKAAIQAQEQGSVAKEDVIENIDADASGAAAQTDVPVLSALFGKTTDEALEIIGHGALVTQNREDDDKSTAVKTNLNVALNDEPADSKTGTPTVYLGLDKKGKVIEVGYSASASALGFGSLSFADAVNKEHVIEKTFARIGFNVPEGSVVLPDDKAKYSTYAKDGVTVERERCTFKDGISVDGTDCTWSAVLSYDYKTQIRTGNLDDTIRIIYVYVSQNVKPDPEPEKSSKAAKAAE